MIKIVAIGGSLRSHSLAYQLLKVTLAKIDLYPQMKTELIDLRQMNLPFCLGETDYPNHPDVALLRQKVQSATGVLLATPEYHGSVSGVLKNALDLLDDEHIEGKMIGLLSVLGGVSSTNALNTLRTICRQLHCWVLPEQIVVAHAEKSFNLEGQLIDKGLEQRIEKFAKHFVEATQKLGISPHPEG